MTPATIRRSRAAEVPALFEIWRAAVVATHHFLSAGDFARIETMVRDWIATAELWVAVDERDEPLAFMALNGAHIDALFVSPAAHRRGLGRELVAHARSLHPCLTVEVNEQQPEAVAFYRALGFRQTARSETDHSGLPYPLLTLAWDREP